MDIILTIDGKIIIDDQGNLLNLLLEGVSGRTYIDTSSPDIGGE
jgi:hypothetical protein